MLRSHAEWHSSNALASRDLLDRLEALMRVEGPQGPEAKPVAAKRQKGQKK